MIVTVESAVKLEKESDAKSAVWVQFLAPPTHPGFKMQMYPRSHESSRSVGQGHDDFSILSALARTSQWSGLLDYVYIYFVFSFRFIDS
jgi:hypothetical protein